jgi:hypothetical protein
MPRRSPETLADYLVVAVCPTLIMLLVGSLCFFLVEVFYQGQYQMRLLFVMAMFVMAIVCVARISMEEGAGYAALFGLPLAIVVAIALMRFVNIQGPLAGISPLINLGLMALIWWSAHKLTWDCTLVDDSQDASGEGLLQHIGLVESPGAANGSRGSAGTSAASEPEATTVASAAEKPWWERFLEADRRPHAPGVWVVYYSLAALPLFGIGGWFIPASDAGVRTRAFLFLLVYVASGLTLLLATSFLGLRRYLRQRRLEMPIEMTATWVGLGLVLIAATLLVATLLPRPGGVYSVAQLPVIFDSPDHRANRYAVGPEGAKENPNHSSSSAAKPQEGQQGSQPGESGTKGKDAANDSKGGKTSGAKGDSGGKSGGSQSGGQQSGGQQSGGEKSGGDKSGGEKSSQGQQGQKSSAAGEQNAKGDSGQKSQQPAQNSNQPSNAGQDSSSQNQEQTAASSPQQPTENQPASPPPASTRSLTDFLPSGNWLGTLMRLLLWGLIIAGGIYLAWRYRAELAAAWRKLLEELRELFGRFGKKPTASAPAISEAPAPPRPFADFADPFLSGAAARMSWPELVRYTFHALEAWGRERRCPRSAGQTPHEFARSIGRADPAVARLVQALADCYGQLAYAPKQQGSVAKEPLRQLWQQMRGA